MLINSEGLYLFLTPLHCVAIQKLLAEKKIVNYNPKDKKRILITTLLLRYYLN